MDRPFERVYTVYDWWDGPRAAFADFDGKPHAYRSIWREDLDDYDPEDRFELSPISEAELRLGLEAWAIWQRWQVACYAGEVPLSSDGALPEDRVRHGELAPLVAQALEIRSAERRVAIGDFRTCAPVPTGTHRPTSRTPLEVQWRPVQE